MTTSILRFSHVFHYRVYKICSEEKYSALSQHILHQKKDSLISICYHPPFHILYIPPLKYLLHLSISLYAELPDLSSDRPQLI